MTAYAGIVLDVWGAIFFLTAPIIVLASLTYFLIGRPSRVLFVGVVISFSLVGVTTGILTGLSRSPVVGAIVPSLLTLLAGIAVLALRSSTHVKIASALAIGCMSLFMLYGTMSGSLLRSSFEQEALSYEARKRTLEVDFLIGQYRKGLGMPEIEVDRCSACEEQE